MKIELSTAINEQINAEIYSAYLYLSMAMYFEDQNLPGFANWMRVQSQEEMTHANKFIVYLNDRGATVTLTGIDGPETKWDSPIDAFKEALTHEEYISSRISKLVSLAIRVEDFAAQSMLNWFVDEQVEEEKNARDIVSKLEMVKDSPGALFMIDKDLGTRVFVDETQLQ